MERFPALPIPVTTVTYQNHNGKDLAKMLGNTSNYKLFASLLIILAVASVLATDNAAASANQHPNTAPGINPAPTSLIANFTYTPANPNVGDAVIFNGTLSKSSGGITSNSWSWGDGSFPSGFFIGAHFSSIISHQFQLNGTFTVTLNITDTNGQTASISKTITVNTITGDTPPAALFTISPAKPLANQTVTFDASLARDPDGDQIANYNWTGGLLSFGGIVSGTRFTGLGKTFSQDFSKTGLYIVSLTVNDTQHFSSSQYTIFAVTRIPYLPGVKQGTFAKYILSTNQAGLGQAIALDQNITQLSGTMVGSDLSAVASNGTSLTIFHQIVDVYSGIIAGPGIFEMTAANLTTGDPIYAGYGSFATVSSTIPEYLAGASRGINVYSLSYPSISYEFDNSTGLLVRLHVLLGGQNTTLVLGDTNAWKATGNEAPLPLFYWSPDNPNPGQLVAFNATNSYDPDHDTGLTYAWTFGDGGNATTITPTHSYAAPGNYTVTLTVADSTGANASASKVIRVGGQTPDFAISASPASITIPQGGSKNSTITLYSLNGFHGTIALESVAQSYFSTSLQSGSLSLKSGSTNSTTLNVSVSPVTPTGSYSINVVASNGTASHQITIGVTVTPPPSFDFFLSSASPGNLTVAQGSTSPSSSITATLVSGSTTQLTFSALGLPAGVTGDFTNNPCSPTCAVTVSFTATASASLGPSTVKILATGGGVTHGILVSLTVTASGISYLPGVKVGDFFSLVVTQASWSSTAPGQTAPSFIALLKATSHIDFTVTAVVGTTVSVQQVWNFNNGTAVSGDATLDVATGSINSTGVLPEGNPVNLILASGLQAPDHVIENPSSSTLNATATRTITGALRTINFQNMTVTFSQASFSMGFAWDQTSGILVSLTQHQAFPVSGGTETIDFALALSQTNIWAANPKPIVKITNITPNPANAGQTVTVSFTVSSSSTITGLTVDWGDGTPTQSLATTETSATHTYSSSQASSTFTINVTATNSAGSGSATTTEIVKSTVTSTKTTPTVTISCSATSLQVGAFTRCAITVTGTSPTGTVTVSSDSLTGVFTPPSGQCTLSAGTCSVTYTDTSSITAILTASYPGDSQNSQGSAKFSLSVVKPSTTLAVATTPSTITSGTASADQTSSTGVSVTITGSTSSDGTPVTIDTEKLSAPSPGVGSVSLSGAGYYDVVLTGTSSGTAKICINYASATSTTTMQYWTGTAWTNATSITVNGATVCGNIPVSALTGTNIAVGNNVQPAPSPPPPPNNTNALIILIGVVAAVIIILAAVAILRRRAKTISQTPTTNQTPT